MNLQHERMLSLCETLSLPFIAQGYAVASQEAAEKETAYSDFLEGLLRTESAGRQVRKQSMLTRLAGFPAIKTLDDFDYQFAAGVKRSQIDELAGLGFVERQENVVLVGPSGGGQDPSGHRLGLPGSTGGYQDAVHDRRRPANDFIRRPYAKPVEDGDASSNQRLPTVDH